MQFHQELLKLGAAVCEIDRELFYDVISLFKVHNYARDVKTKVPFGEARVVKGKNLLTARGVIILGFAKENDIIRAVCFRLLGIEKQVEAISHQQQTQHQHQIAVHPFLPVHINNDQSASYYPQQQQQQPQHSLQHQHTQQPDLNYVLQHLAPAPAAQQQLHHHDDATPPESFSIPNEYISQLDAAMLGDELDFLSELDVPSGYGGSSGPFDLNHFHS